MAKISLTWDNEKHMAEGGWELNNKWWWWFLRVLIVQLTKERKTMKKIYREWKIKQTEVRGWGRVSQSNQWKREDTENILVGEGWGHQVNIYAKLLSNGVNGFWGENFEVIYFDI